MKRMNKKKWMVLWMILLLGLAGCGKQQEMPAEEQEPLIEVEQKPEIAPEEEKKEEVPLHISTEKHMKTYYLEDEETPYLYLQYCDVSVEGKAYENLRRALENWSLEKSEELRGVYQSYEEPAKTEALLKGDEFYPAMVYQNVYLARADEAVVSLVEEMQQNGSISDGTYTETFTGLNYETDTGKKLGLRDVVTDWKVFSEAAVERMLLKCVEVYEEALTEDAESIIRAIFEEEKEPVWYLDASGIVLIYGQSLYETDGTERENVKVHLPYAEFGQWIKAAYLPKNADGVALLEENQEVQWIIGNEQDTVPFILQCNWQDEEMPTAYVKLGEKKKNLDTFTVLGKCYLIRKDGESYCLIQYDTGSDDYVTNVYRLTDGVLTRTDHVEASVDPGSVSPWKIDMERWVYVLGTYGGRQTYQFTEEGKLITEDTEYQLEGNDFVLTTKIDLAVTMEEQETTLPAGSHVVLTATDNDSYVKFVIRETGQSGSLKISRNAKEYYRIVVDGRDEYDCFEILPYAG